MDLCHSTTFNETWNCLKEENGEYLPIIIFAECMWWLFVLVIMRGIVQGIRRWWEKKKLAKRMKQEWTDKWTFPPKRNN